MSKKKMRINALFTLIVITVSLLVPVAPAGAAEDTIRVFLNGREIACEVPPMVVDSRVLIPIRAISEGMGFDVNWDQTHQAVLINRGQGGPSEASTTYTGAIGILVDGQPVDSEVAPVISGSRVLAPLRVIAEALELQPSWDNYNRFVVLTGEAPAVDSNNPPDNVDVPNIPVTPETPVSTTNSSPDLAALNDPYHVTIEGDPIATADQLKAILMAKNPSAPDVVDLYLSIGKIYGIRGDVAFCQAALETGWWKYGGDALPEQNNYCGLGVTGTPVADAATEPLRGADPANVWFVTGKHGAWFSSPAVGVEAQIQHLYAYVHGDDPGRTVPAGRTLYDPRFTLVGDKAVTWQDLSGRWAVPGIGYGQDIIDSFLKPALQY